MRLSESLLFFWNFGKLAVNSFGGVRAADLYKILGDNNHLGEREDYLNLGLWSEDTTTLDQACENLADLMAHEAGFTSGTKLLDVGCGFGAQDFFWQKKYKFLTITALNICDDQVKKANARAARLGIGSVKFINGDATKLNFIENEFDFVAGLESAFHFKTRENFFREAFRVLKPGGKLVLADLAGARTGASPWGRMRMRAITWMSQIFWQIPSENLYPLEDYQRRIERAGFRIIKAYSIFARVHPPFKAYAVKRLQSPEIKQRLNPVFYWLLNSSLKMQRKVRVQPMDYILVVAERP